MAVSLDINCKAFNFLCVQLFQLNFAVFGIFRVFRGVRAGFASQGKPKREDVKFSFGGICPV